MKIRNFDFGSYVFGQSGIQGFFAEGDEYKHHKWYKCIPGFSFKGMNFVAKTVTLHPRVYPDTANTELEDSYKIKRFFPSSVWWSVRSLVRGYMLNAIGLANPGLSVMLRHFKWQKRSDAFQLSVSLDGKTMEQKIEEVKMICAELNLKMPLNRLHRYAIQINDSCPNKREEQKQSIEDSITIYRLFKTLMPGIALIPKFAVTVDPETISALRPHCDAFCISNTIPFGEMKERVKWSELFEGGTSPLAKQLSKEVKGEFKGGLSGAPLFQVLVEWLTRMEAYDDSVTIIAGGGIMKKKNLDRLAQFRIVRGVAIGSVAILRPWRLQGLIDYGNQVFGNR